MGSHSPTIRIPLFALDRQERAIEPEIIQAITGVMRKGTFILGDHVAAFEKEFAAFTRTSYAVGVASGTDALTLSLRAVGVKPGDEVIIPANVYPTAFGVAMSGARIKLIDCGPDALMDFSRLPETVSPATKAIVAVHLYGNPVDILLLRRLLADMGRTDIAVIEDCAQAHGAWVTPTEHVAREGSNRLKKTDLHFLSAKKIPVGSMGDVACFSFYPSKNLGAYGDGGMICTNDPDIYKRVLSLRMYGEVGRYRSTEISGVSRLDELQASILSVKLRHLPEWNARRKQIAKQYRTLLEEKISMIPFVSGSVHHLAILKTDRRDALSLHLRELGIGTAIHYPVPVHLTEAFLPLGYHPGDFPVSESMSESVLSIPLYPELTDPEIEEIAAEILVFCKKT